MRSRPGSYDLSFIVPRDGLKPPGDVCFHVLPWGCQGTVEAGLVRIHGGSREGVFDAAAVVVTGMIADKPLAISAILHTPARPSGFDRWHIIAGARVAFAPTAIDPYFPRLVASAPAELGRP